jgi:tRNA(adenine34) deaminase
MMTGPELFDKENVTPDERDRHWMSRAIGAAIGARELGEVPVGACVVTTDGTLLSLAGNRTRIDHDPTAHAEVLALRAAGVATGNYRLNGVTVYSTIEPCAMCAGALVHARVARLVYGAADERFGAVVSQFRLCDSSVLNHQMEISAGVMEAECRELMQTFFRHRRADRKSG